MKEAKNNYFGFFNSIIDSIWKSSQETSTKFTINLFVKKCISGKIPTASIKDTKEFLSEVWYLFLIPKITGK
jgi:hypothetical protein